MTCGRCSALSDRERRTYPPGEIARYHRVHVMKTGFTRREWALLPEGFPAQLIKGHLVKEPPPTYGHQGLVGRLHLALCGVVSTRLVVLSPTDVEIDDYNVFQPDIVVLRDPPALTATNVGIPRVAIEVLSPGTRRRDRAVKAPMLLDAGVEEVWLIDAEQGAIEVRTPLGTRVSRGLDGVRSAAIPELELLPDVLFEDLRPPPGQ